MSSIGVAVGFLNLAFVPWASSGTKRMIPRAASKAAEMRRMRDCDTVCLRKIQVERSSIMLRDMPRRCQGFFGRVRPLHQELMQQIHLRAAADKQRGSFVQALRLFLHDALASVSGGAFRLLGQERNWVGFVE